MLGVHWKGWCWSWNSNTLATSCEELTHWKRPWCWEGLGAGGEGDDRGWDDWMASLTRWTWVWVNSRSWWWTGRPGVLRFMGSQRVRQDWATELNWTWFLFFSYPNQIHQQMLLALPWTISNTWPFATASTVTIYSKRPDHHLTWPSVTPDVENSSLSSRHWNDFYFPIPTLFPVYLLPF